MILGVACQWLSLSIVLTPYLTDETELFRIHAGYPNQGRFDWGGTRAVTLEAEAEADDGRQKGRCRTDRPGLPWDCTKT